MLWDLSKSPGAEILARLARERRSGDLHVRSNKIVKIIFFDHGRIVFAASNMKKDRLGEALVATGRISDDDFKRATALMREGEVRRRFGDALVRAGVMDKKELGRSVARQVKRIVLSLFEFTEGAASFEDRPCVIPLEYMVSVSVHRLLYMGIKLMKNRELILTGLGDLDRWVTLAEVPPFRFGLRKCSAEELEILEQSKRKVTLRRLAWAPGGLSMTRLRAAYSMLASGVLEDATSPSRSPAPPFVQMETSTFLLSALRTRPDPSAREALQMEVAQELQRSSRLDREAWLKVSRAAPREELVRALEEKMDRYHSLLEAAGEDEPLRRDIEVILGRASSMMRLARQTPGTPPNVRISPSPSAEAASTTPAAPEPGAAVEEPAAVVEPPAAPEPEADTEPPAPAPAAAPERLTSPAPDAPATPDRPAEASPASAVIEAQGTMTIEHLMMEGEVRMTVSDYANAVKVYSRLVDFVPNAANFRIKLAIAMAFHPPTAKLAEREFLEAVRLDPQNADIHFQFALYYKAMRVKSRAITELQTAVRLNPKHKLARQELETLSPKDSALTSLKKLFR